MGNEALLHFDFHDCYIRFEEEGPKVRKVFFLTICIMLIPFSLAHSQRFDYTWEPLSSNPQYEQIFNDVVNEFGLVPPGNTLYGYVVRCGFLEIPDWESPVHGYVDDADPSSPTYLAVDFAGLIADCTLEDGTINFDALYAMVALVLTHEFGHVLEDPWEDPPSLDNLINHFSMFCTDIVLICSTVTAIASSPHMQPSENTVDIVCDLWENAVENATELRLELIYKGVDPSALDEINDSCPPCDDSA
jgi:hypothetical protein